jgi:hypothetical protein
MPNGHSTTRSFSFLTSFTTSDRQSAERAFAEQEDRRGKARDARARQAEQLDERVQRQVHNLLGARKFAELRHHIQAERLSFADLFQPPEGLKRDYDKQKKARKHKIDALLRTLGADRKKIKEIVRAADAKVEAMLPPDTRDVAQGFNLQNNLPKWAKLSPLHKFPLPWGPVLPDDDPNDPHRWFLFRPPFFGFLFSEDFVTSDHFRADRLLFLHPPSGLVGNEATMDCDDADNWDLAHVIAEAQIAFAFTPPTTGLIEVLIDAQSTIGTHHVKIEDEWGFSDAWCNQSNYLMMNVLHPNVPEPSLALMSNMYKKSGGGDLTADEEHLTRGQHYFAQLFSSGPVSANQSVIITAGTRTLDVCRANDMELHSRTNFQWFISSVEVRIAP